MDQEARREQILRRLGMPTDRVAPEAVVGSAEDAGACTRTLVEYTVERGERVRSWLLRPAGAPPPSGWPGILACHQHAGQYHLGKGEPAGLSGDPQYHYGLELCRRGAVVLCPDHLCFEDRRPPAAERERNPALDGAGYETFEFTRRLLEGSCLQAKYLHDLAQALDVLAGLPKVDERRLGAIGHSLGGQEVLWLAWFDRRVRAVVSSCGFGTLRSILRDGINHNKGMYVPGLLEVGDLDALLPDIAPRAFMLSAGEQDAIFPIDGVRELAEVGTSAWREAGAPERFRTLSFSGGHGFPPEVREEAYAFLERWLR